MLDIFFYKNEVYTERLVEFRFDGPDYYLKTSYESYHMNLSFNYKNFNVQSTYQQKLFYHKIIEVLMQGLKLSLYWSYTVKHYNVLILRLLVAPEFRRVVSYQRLKTIKKFKSPELKVVTVGYRR